MTVCFRHPIEGHDDPCDGRTFHDVKAISHDSRNVEIVLGNDRRFCVARVLVRDRTIAYKINRAEVSEMFGVKVAETTEVYAVMEVKARSFTAS